jgi:AcrR family transcriptional regulator
MSNTSANSKKQARTPRSKQAPVSDAPAKPYHHGALRESILKAAEDILEQEGIEGLTLRAAARAAGVSHAAPKNHFDDLTGLLSELAAIGFERFSEALLQASAGAGDPPQSRMNALGRAYVGFARAHPGMFLLMFRNERLDMERPALRNAYLKARNALAGPVKARIAAAGETNDAGSESLSDPSTPTLEQSAAMVSAWSLVHGFSMLLIDHRLDPILERQPQPGNWQSLLDAVFASILSRHASK